MDFIELLEAEQEKLSEASKTSTAVISRIVGKGKEPVRKRQAAGGSKSLDDKITRKRRNIVKWKAENNPEKNKEKIARAERQIQRWISQSSDH